MIIRNHPITPRRGNEPSAQGIALGKSGGEVSPCKGKRNNRRRRLRLILLPFQGGGYVLLYTQGDALGY